MSRADWRWRRTQYICMMAYNGTCTAIGQDNGTKACQLYYLKIHQQSDMMYAETLWQEVLEEMLPRFKEAGAMRQVVTQVWNQEGSFILGNLWEYKDEKAFIACQELFREAEAKMDERTDIAKIITPSRGIILRDIRL